LYIAINQAHDIPINADIMETKNNIINVLLKYFNKRLSAKCPHKLVEGKNKCINTVKIGITTINIIKNNKI
tara:strand:+ start:320 stop:532 length:213 start_codon:yes stop_codon:yes gene_type:complete